MSANPLSPRAAAFVSSSKLRAVLAFAAARELPELIEAHHWCRANGSPQKADLILQAIKRFAPGGLR